MVDCNISRHKTVLPYLWILFPDYYMSILDLKLIKNGSVYHMLSLPQMLHEIPLLLTILFQKIKDELILYLIMLKIIHLYLTYMTTISNMRFIMSPSTDMILVMGT